MEENKIPDRKIVEYIINCVLKEFNISDKNSESIHLAIIDYCKILIFINKCGENIRFLKKRGDDGL